MIPERDRIQTVMTTEEIAAAMELGDYSAEMLLQHLVRRYNEDRQLADRLAGDLSDLWHHYTLTGAAYEIIESALTAWKASRDQNGASQKPFNPIPSAEEIDAHLDECAARSERDWRPLDGDNLEGPGPTEEERRANARAIQAMSEQERFDLMFHGPNKQEP